LQSDYAPIRYERELRIFRRYCPSGRVLDVGCSTGAFLYQLGRQFPGQYETVGTDVVTEAIAYAASKGLAVEGGDFLTLQLGNSLFDAITFWAVIEHLAEPSRYLQRAAELLAKGGHCFVLVPNVNSLAMRLLGNRYRYLMAEHLNYFSGETLRRWGESSGTFHLLGLVSSHFNPLVILADAVGRRGRPEAPERARLLATTTRWKQNPFLRPVKYVYDGCEAVLNRWKLGDNLIMILQKSESL